jgi:hypothetical protein
VQFRPRLTTALPVLVLTVLAGCAGIEPEAPRSPEATQPVDPVVWRLVDDRLWTASLAARREALLYAKRALDGWMDRVRGRTETEFIPWYTSFATQQWLSFKSGWYAMSQSNEGPTPAERLTRYLQREYYARVLEPISGEINPRVIMERAALGYLSEMRREIREVRREFQLPAQALDRRLDRVPAIRLAAQPPKEASLGDLVDAEAGDATTNPAFRALVSKVRLDEGGDATALGDHDFVPVTPDSAQALAERFGVRGGASAAALAAGGFGGLLISVGISAWQAMEHEQDKPAMAAELRKNLNRAMTGLRHDLLINPSSGIMSAVNHMGSRIENALFGRDRPPGVFGPNPPAAARDLDIGI